MNFLGIDVGTGGTRAILVDTRGSIVSSATVEHQPFASPRVGWAEQDARDWWRATQEAVRALLSQDGVRAEEIGAVGLSGQMQGAVLLDKRDEVLRPAIIWCDQRTEEQCRALTWQIGAARIIELTCNPALTGFTLPKMMWVREHEPDVWRRVRSVLLPKDYVRLQLTDEKATDVADAYGRAVETVLAEEGADYGAALLAGVGSGAWPTVDAACEAVVRVSDRHSPEPSAVKTLDQQYEAFRALDPALRNITERLPG
jgi:xylulokinase